MSRYNILVVEDNLGDFTLVEDFLYEKMESPLILLATSFEDAKEKCLFTRTKFDVILLDLTLPDRQGEELIMEMMALCNDVPVIVLTGHVNFAFSIKSLSFGIADYMLKEELTALSLYKSIIYCIERKKSCMALEESETKYSQLFHLSPLPMWVVDTDTYKFLDVNIATVENYGYTREEFLSMNLKDIRTEEHVELLKNNIEEVKKNPKMVSQYVVVHKKKNGDLRNVEVRIAPLQYRGLNANLVIATDITENLKYTEAIEEQNRKLSEIAWTQSHVVRAPLARIMGLVYLIKDMEDDLLEKERLLDHIVSSANELDCIIREISDKTTAVKY